MFRRALLFTVMAVAVSTPAAAQLTTFTRSYHACLPGVSCHRATVTWTTYYHADPFPYFVGWARLESFFGHNPWGAGLPLAMYSCQYPFPQWEEMCETPTMWSVQAQPYFNETYPLAGYGTLKWVGVRITYGQEQGQWGLGPYGALIELTATPEPASMILLGTGLGALALARRKRNSRSNAV
jgi:hypothetical protein